MSTSCKTACRSDANYFRTCVPRDVLTNMNDTTEAQKWIKTYFPDDYNSYFGDGQTGNSAIMKFAGGFRDRDHMQITESDDEHACLWFTKPKRCREECDPFWLQSYDYYSGELMLTCPTDKYKTVCTSLFKNPPPFPGTTG